MYYYSGLGMFVCIMTITVDGRSCASHLQVAIVQDRKTGGLTTHVSMNRRHICCSFHLLLNPTKRRVELMGDIPLHRAGTRPSCCPHKVVYTLSMCSSRPSTVRTQPWVWPI